LPNTTSKGANIREFLRGNSFAGKKAVLLFVGKKSVHDFRSQHSGSDETGLQNVILIKPLPSWNYRVSRLQGNLNIM
jgi:hypothetical protein